MKVLALLKMSSIAVIATNALRAIVLISMILAFAAELVELRNDVVSFQAATNKNSTSAAPSTATSPTIDKRALFSRSPVKKVHHFGKRQFNDVLGSVLGDTTIAIQATATTSIQSVEEGESTTATTRSLMTSFPTHTSAAQAREPVIITITEDDGDSTTSRRATSSARPTTIPSSDSSEGEGNGDSKQEAQVENPNKFVGNTSIPSHIGAIGFIVINHIIRLILIVLIFFSELCLPLRRIENFYLNHLPLLGPNYGVFPLGVFVLYLGSEALCRFIGTFAKGVSWLLVVVGILNLIAGVVLRVHIKTIRELIPSAPEKVTRVLPLPASVSSNPILEKGAHKAFEYGSEQLKARGGVGGIWKSWKGKSSNGGSTGVKKEDIGRPMGEVNVQIPSTVYDPLTKH